MLEYNEIKPRKYIVHDGEPCEVVSAHVFRKQQRKPVNATKLKNLITGKVVEHSFHVSDKVEEANLETRTVKYLYENKDEYWFCEEKNPSQRFSLSVEQVGDQMKYIKQNSLVDLLSFGDRLIGVQVPIKVELKVIDAPPAVKGNTVQGGVKQVTLEGGAVVNAPMFINEGDVIRINTESGDYVERVSV
jgi:elongation factor P